VIKLKVWPGQIDEGSCEAGRGAVLGVFGAPGESLTPNSFNHFLRVPG